MKRFSQDMLVRENALTSISSLTGNKSWRFLLLTFVSLMMFTAFGILSGCSGGGGGGGGTTSTTSTDTNTDTSTDDTQSYTGSAKVSGTIKLSYLSSSDKALIESDDTASPRTVRPRGSKAVSTDTEAVKLYVVGPDGELLDTGITCDFDDDGSGDRTYECDGVKDGVNYIVRYVQINPDTDKALELTTNAYVPAGETAQEGEGDVTPQTSVVVKALVDAIISATEGADIDDAVVTTIIESVKTAIETLVTTGAIQVPSMVVDVDDDTTLDTLVGEETENEKLDNTSGLILTDDSVDKELGFIAASTQAEAFNLADVDTAEEKEALIRKVFKDLLTEDSGEEEDMPDFFYNFFIWHYVNNRTITAEALLQALIVDMEYFCGDNQSCTDASVYYGTAISAITVANVLTLFNSEMASLQALLAKDPTTLTDAEKENLAQFPPVIRGLFPASMGAVTTSTNLVAPQGIALVIFFEEVFMSSGDYLGDAASDDDWWEWDDGSLFEALGMQTYVQANPDEFTGIEIFGLYLHPGSVWIQGDASNNYQGYELEALMGGTDLTDLSQFASGGDADVTSGVDVTLTYPKKDGTTDTIELLYITRDNDPYGYWGIDPWAESQMDPSCTDPQQQDCMSPYIEANPDRIASDFTGGSYTVTVYESGTTTVLATKTFTKKVITGMLNTYVKLLSPAGQPNYPGDNATQEELDDYNEAWNLFYNNVGYTTFAPTRNSDGVIVETGATHAKVTVSWKAPEVVLPEGVKMFYDIQVGTEDCDGTGNCTWNDLWNTWQADKRVYTTSFTLPVLLPKLADAYDHYNLNVGVNFVDTETGEYLGRGGSAYTQFSVGDPIDKNATFEISGTFNISDGALNSEGSAMASTDLRIALIKETSVDNTFTQTVIAVNDITSTGDGKGTYTLTPTIGDFLDNAGMNTWFNLIMIEDPTDSLSADSLLDNMTMMYWPDYSAGGIWFDTWGGMLRVYKDSCTTDGTCFSEEKIIIGTGEEEVTGPKFNIGGDYGTAPDPSTVTPVSAGDLATDFTITGNVDVTNVGQPVVAMIKGAYNSTVGYWTETILSIGTITTGEYSLTVSVGDFFDADGYPIDAYFDLVLIDDATDAANQVAEGESIDYGYVMVYWPDYSATSFWFDTWRGEMLYVIKETFNPDTSVWTKEQYDVPTTYTTVPGPDLAMPVY